MDRKFVLFAVDAVLINIAILLSYYIRFDQVLPAVKLNEYMWIAVLFTGTRLLTFSHFRLYDRMWQYASIGELISTIRAVSLGTVINVFAGFFLVPGTVFLSKGVVMLDWMLTIILIGGSRLGWRMIRDGCAKNACTAGSKRILIVGAGDAGIMVAKELRNHYNGSIQVVGFIDDDPVKHNLQIMDISVLGGRETMPQIVAQHRIDEVIIAMPSVGSKVIRAIVALCQQTNARVKILPGMFDLIDGKVTINEIREVEVEDLLGRDPVKVDLAKICKYIKGQVILVSGAGGSIGSELCRQIVAFKPKVLLLLDICENNVYDIEMELKELTSIPLIPLVKDVRDQDAIKKVFKEYKPKIVFHAAAHKHVPLMEANPEEAIKNNSIGTYNVAQAANLYGAERFVLISTDKAVNPTSVMGASKRVAEMIIQHLDRTSQTNYVAVRFGNVLGSRGSVVPLFKKQIMKGGPVTVTHQDMVRYFMTIPEAVQLVIQAGTMAQGGEIFVLDMGDPVRIMDLARSLIKLSGFTPGEDIDIKVTGMRPGEKLYEELLTADEGVNSTSHQRIFVAKPQEINTREIEAALRSFVSGWAPHGQAETEQWFQRFLPDFKIVWHGQSQKRTSQSESISGLEEIAATFEDK